MSTPLPDVVGAADFGVSARRVLDYLHAALPLALWSVTRVEGDRQTHLFVDEDNPYGVHPGVVQVWEASFCIRLATGAVPSVALDVQAVPDYAAAAARQDQVVRTYAGAVLREADGTVFGTICGADPEARTGDRALAEAGPVLILLGQLLSMSLQLDRARTRARLELDVARMAAETDALTGLANRRAWERELKDVGVLHRRLGDPTVVVVLDLDGLKEVNDTAGHAAGDAHLRRAAAAIRAGVGDRDMVARLGGDEFGVLLRSCVVEDAETAVARVRHHLAAAGVPASVGWAPVSLRGGLPAAQAEADAAMYAAKRSGRTRPRTRPLAGRVAPS